MDETIKEYLRLNIETRMDPVEVVKMECPGCKYIIECLDIYDGPCSRDSNICNVARQIEKSFVGSPKSSNPRKLTMHSM